jgi:hypothetical protein
MPTPNDVRKAQEKDKEKVDDNPTGESYIVFKQPAVIDGVATIIEHGPMPVSEWAAYEKENGL